jgi:hypothetical protein
VRRLAAADLPWATPQVTRHTAALSLRGEIAIIAPNEGEMILQQIKEADHRIADAVEQIVEHQRAFAMSLDGLTQPSGKLPLHRSRRKRGS